MKDNNKKKEKDVDSSHKRNRSEGEVLKQDKNQNFMKLNGEEINNSHNDRLIAPSELSKRLYSDHQEVSFFSLISYLLNL